MKKKGLWKDFFMEIKKTKARFCSILLISALGVAFFSGVRATEPDMKKSADVFYDASNMMDIRVIGELGLTEEDADAIRAIEGVKEVQTEYFCDLIWQQGSEASVLKVMSTPKDINQITITSGRLPNASGECLVDEKLADDHHIKIGDQITLSGENEEDIFDYVKEENYTVTGIGKTALYLSLERGTTSIGNGTLDGFLIIDKDDFTMEAFTQISITVDGAKELLCYSDTYDDLVEEVTDKIEEISGDRNAIRYQEVRDEALSKIADGKQEIEDAKQELMDAKEELDQGEQELEDAQKDLEEGERELKKGKNDILSAQQKITDGEQQLLDGQKEYEKGVEEIVAAMDELKAADAELAAYEQQTEQGLTEIEANKETVSAAIQQIEAAIAQLQSLEASAETEAQIAQLQAQKEGLDAQLSQINAAHTRLLATREVLKQQRAEWSQGYYKIKQGLQELQDAKKLLEEKQKELEDGKKSLVQARSDLKKGQNEINDAKTEIADAKIELEDGKKEYEEKSKDAWIEIADAEQEIADAQKAIDELKDAKWYVLDRNTLQTYVEYGQNADRIGAIGKVFPFLFFLVAALVSLTTMTRMVEEQRTQIGTLKALGYTKREIGSKYIMYAFFATVFGSILGSVLGEKLLPFVIITAYKIMYNNLPQVLTPIHPGFSFMACGLAIVCTVGAAFGASSKVFQSVPAQLMRPEAPKAGKRVLLERIPFLWKRLNFTQKATIRNLMRYKKRFFMTVFGIGGCMALLLVGYGIKDSLLCVADVEFAKIRHYDGIISIDKNCDEQEKEELQNILEQDEQIQSYVYAREKTVDVGSKKDTSTRMASLIVPSDTEQWNDYILLQERTQKEKLTIEDDGVIITEKLAKLLSVKPGDEITIKEGDTKTVTAFVTAITENYFMHYIYMSPDLYEAVYGYEPEYEELFFLTNGMDALGEEQMQTDYMKYNAVTSVSFLRGTSERVREMLKSMDTLIYVLVISAGLLAFVVLFNLNNINITERRRELATLRVLGFYNKEVSQYVFRENIILTVIGIGVGMILGTILHRFVILTAEIDTMMFGRDISLMSFLYSILLTFLFSAGVNILMHFTLKKIDMVESLKSIE